MTPWLRRNGASALGLLFLALLPFLVFWRVTLGQGAFADGDLSTYNFPLLHTLAEQWRAGRLPLWNPWIFGGTPLHANMQGGAFYLPNLLLLAEPRWLAYQYSILLHYSLTAVFTFLYLRALPLRRTAALLGAIVFAFGGFAMGHLGHVSTLRTIPWLPLVLFALERWRRTRAWRYPTLGALAVGLMLLAGHPQIPLYALLLAGAYAVRLVALARPTGRMRLARGLLLVFLGGVGLAAIQWLPTLQLARSEYLRPMDRSYQYFVSYSLNPLHLVQLVVPRLYPLDEAELTVFVGVPTLVLALLGAWPDPHRRRRPRLFFLVTAVVGLALSFGRFTPLAPALFAVPLYNLFTSPARNLFEVQWALAVLAALGTHALLRLAPPRRQARATVSAALLLVLLGALAVSRSLSGTLDTDGPSVALGDIRWTAAPVPGRLALLGATLVLLWLVPRGRRARQALALLLCLAAAADVAWSNSDIYPLRPPSTYTTVPAVAGFLRRQPQRGRTLSIEWLDAEPDTRRAILAPDTGAVFGIESVNGFDSLMLRVIDLASGHMMPTYGLVCGAGAYNQPQFRRFLDLLNVRYVLAPAEQVVALAPPRYRPVYRDALVQVYLNTDALPRALVVPEAHAVDREQALGALASGLWAGRTFDPRRIALVEGIRPLPVASGAARAPARVTLLEESAGRARLRVESTARGVLVYSTTYSAGWRAFVDDAPARTCRVDGLLVGLEVPDGRHEVRLEYLPSAFVWGAVFSLVTVVLLSVAWLRSSR